MSDELDPQAPVTNEDVEGHGIEEDDVEEAAESLTLCGVCIGKD